MSGPSLKVRTAIENLFPGRDYTAVRSRLTAIVAAEPLSLAAFDEFVATCGFNTLGLIRLSQLRELLLTGT